MHLVLSASYVFVIVLLGFLLIYVSISNKLGGQSKGASAGLLKPVLLHFPQLKLDPSTSQTVEETKGSYSGSGGNRLFVLSDFPDAFFAQQENNVILGF